MLKTAGTEYYVQPKVNSDGAWRRLEDLCHRARGGTQNLEKNKEKFEADDDPPLQIIDINEARGDGIMRISDEKAE